MQQREPGVVPDVQSARPWHASLGRADVQPPRLARGAGAFAEEQRRPIAAELRRVSGLAMLNLAAVALLIISGVLVVTYMSSHGVTAPLHLHEVVQWLRDQRGTW